MTVELLLVLAIFVFAIVFFVTEWLRVDIVALCVVIALMVSGLLSVPEALSGFSHPVVLTIVSLFIVGGAVLQTGLAGAIGRRILNIAGKDETRLTVVIMLAVALLSAFMSDTGTVAVLLPAIISLARATKISPSKLLIPLSFGSLLGGATTLIGTPPNIIVSNLLRAEGETPFEFFSYTPVGLLLLAAGVAFMVTVGQRLLPDRSPQQDAESQLAGPKELVDIYRLPDKIFHLRVTAESELVGETITDSRLGTDFDVSVLELLRKPQARPANPVPLPLQPNTPQAIQPKTETRLQVDDILVVQGEEANVRQAVTFWNLTLQPVNISGPRPLVTQEAGVAEVLLPPRSALIDKTLVETRFGSVYKLTVLNILRRDEILRSGLKDIALQPGDILLVQGYWEDILALKRKPNDFVVLGQPETAVGAPYRHRAPVALLILFGMLVMLVLDVAPLATISMTAALAMILTGCLTMDDAYAAIDWKSIVLIAGMLPMSTAMEKVGLVSLVAEGLTRALGDLGPLAILAGLFLLTSAFTQVISNTATTVLIAPIALAAARGMSVHPQAFMMAIAIAASMAFATPVASPVNTLVMGAGNYRFSDYLKIGIPLIFIMLAVVVVALPLLFPF